MELNINTILIAVFGFAISTGVSVLAWLLNRFITGFDQKLETCTSGIEKCTKAVDECEKSVGANAERFQAKLEKLDDKLQASAEKMREDISRRDADNHQEFRAMRDKLHRIAESTHALVSRAAVDARSTDKT